MQGPGITQGHIPIPPGSLSKVVRANHSLTANPRGLCDSEGSCCGYTPMFQMCFLFKTGKSPLLHPMKALESGKCQQNPPLLQGHVPAMVSAGQGTHIVFMAEVHSLQGLPGYALHQVLWHPVGKNTVVFWPLIITPLLQGK